eukprot:TRINITY_DN197_c0_g2_i3.p2 TRINITY_DN197_c0_g2~~TRINITY_DN197_c0_g2_i3.p2  ORF type:complete len:451 (-),score=191.45 TRINITY_DN197_c0_g2_i3:2661-4013(-)
MSSRFVRSSKYRHIFGKGSKKEDCYDNLKPSKSAWDSNKVDANNKYAALLWESRGGGSFAVIDLEKKGKYPTNTPLVSGHKANVLDIACSPFNDSVIASVSEDGFGRIWNIPEGGLTENLNDPVQKLIGHRRKVGTVKFHPTAENVIVTSSTDYTVKIWDIETGQVKLDIPGHANIIQSVEWNRNGSLIATSCKDKKIRVLDPRQQEIVSEAAGHPGVKGSRIIWLGDKGTLFNVGFSRASDRCYSILDKSNLSTPITKKNIDTSSGIIMPFYDNDTGMLYLAGKGDGNVRYYEMVNDAPYIHFVSEYKSSTPQLGMNFVPKTICNVSECEVAKALKVSNNMVEPISFTVPRKQTAMFQDDIFPPTAGPDPALSGADWFSGQDADPILISLEDGFVPVVKEAFVAEVVAEEEKELTEKEVREEFEKLKKRVAFLEAEMAKKDARIKELGG